MKANSFIRSVVTACLTGILLTGCGTVPSQQPVTLQNNILPRPGAKISLGQVSNTSGKTFDHRVDEMLHEALLNSLQKEKLLPAAPDTATFSLDMQITDYAAGNAFKRWLVPGYGSTVLSVKGSLRNISDQAVVGTVEHSRSVIAGGLYTVGAWSTIMNTVADEIAHDLEIKIEKGGDFSLSVAPRAQRTPVAPVATTAFTVKLNPITDQRAETGRIGERTLPFKGKWNDVYFSRRVPDYFSEALSDELQLIGGKPVKAGEDLQVSPRLTKFWVATEVTPLYWDIIAEVECDLSITRTGSTEAPVEKVFSGRKKVRTYVYPSVQLMSGALESSLDELFSQMRTDEIWRDPPTPVGAARL